MVQQEALPRPHRGWSWVRTESTSSSIAIVAVGAAGITIVLLGTLAVVSIKGFVPLADIVDAFKSGTLRMLLYGGIVLGLISSVAGWGTYRRMPTKVSREEAIAGAVLGLQALVAGALILFFTMGDVQKIAENYLRFAPVGEQIGAFLTGARNTMLLAVLGELFGIIIGVILAIFLISKRSTVRAPARVYVNLFRGTPLLLQVAFIGIGLPLGFGINLSTFTAAAIAFSLNTGAYSAEVFRAGIQSIERGQMEAARGLGMSYLQAMRYSILPQAVRRIIPPLMNEFVILIKDTSLIFVLPLTATQRDIFSVANQAVGNTYNATFLLFAGVAYLVVTLPLIRLVNWVEKRLRSGLVGVTA